MTREDAEREAAARQATEKGRGVWLARPDGDAWSVVRVEAPGLVPLRAAGAHVESRPKPPMADDPRPASWRNVPPGGGAA